MTNGLEHFCASGTELQFCLLVKISRTHTGFCSTTARLDQQLKNMTFDSLPVIESNLFLPSVRLERGSFDRFSGWFGLKCNLGILAWLKNHTEVKHQDSSNKQILKTQTWGEPLTQESSSATPTGLVLTARQNRVQQFWLTLMQICRIKGFFFFNLPKPAFFNLTTSSG